MNPEHALIDRLLSLPREQIEEMERTLRNPGERAGATTRAPLEMRRARNRARNKKRPPSTPPQPLNLRARPPTGRRTDLHRTSTPPMRAGPNAPASLHNNRREGMGCTA